MLMDKKSKEQNNTAPYITEDVLINVLLRLPAKVLHKSMRLVCKHWASIIHDRCFIEAHLHQSNTGMFVFNIGSSHPSRFFEIIGADTRVTDLSCRFPGRMLASRDGVILFNDSNNHRAFWLANPVTMQFARLPSLDVPLEPVFYRTYMARVSSTGKYKVVHWYEDLNNVFHWLVMTVGIDNSWRKIDYQQSRAINHKEIAFSAVSAGGMIYWPEYIFQFDGFNCFLAMDVVHETMCKVPIPSECVQPSEYLEMGDYLSGFVINLSLLFEVYVLKDLHRGEWSKVYDIDMGIVRGVPQRPTLVMPIGWLNNDAVVILEVLTYRGEIFVIFDAKKKETRILDLGICGRRFFTHIHTDSLVSW